MPALKNEQNRLAETLAATHYECAFRAGDAVGDQGILQRIVAPALSCSGALFWQANIPTMFV
jgi:hypothetical protein